MHVRFVSTVLPLLHQHLFSLLMCIFRFVVVVQLCRRVNWSLGLKTINVDLSIIIWEKKRHEKNQVKKKNLPGGLEMRCVPTAQSVGWACLHKITFRHALHTHTHTQTFWTLGHYVCIQCNTVPEEPAYQHALVRFSIHPSLPGMHADMQQVVCVVCGAH